MDVSRPTPPIEKQQLAASESDFDSIRDDLAKVDREFQKNLGSRVPIISEIGEYLRRSGGKRFRAKLLLLSAKLCGYHGDLHISMASLIEFIHTATLLHDDVVDKAEVRRGSASANAIWGNEPCVLVGDFLFTKCFSLLVESRNWGILQTVSDATMLMAEGELQELLNTGDILLTEENYLSIVSRKTAILISAATKIGAILGNVPGDREKALSDFGMDVGIAFQLIDDNLDYTSKQEEFGKKIGIDLQEGKITLPLIFTLSRCTPEEKLCIQKTLETHPVTEEAFFDVVRLIERYEGIQYTRKRAREYVERAKRHLDLFPDSKDRQALFAMADYILERKL
jgi:octaprenyl-diphosphate synthase